MKSCKNTIQESIKPLSLSTNSLHWLNAVLPEAIKYLPIWLDPQHDIVCGGVVDEGALGVDEEHVRDPDLLHQPAIKGHALVVGAGEGKPLILPVVPQVKRHGEILQETGFCHNLDLIRIVGIAPLWHKPWSVKHLSWGHIHSPCFKGLTSCSLFIHQVRFTGFRHNSLLKLKLSTEWINLSLMCLHLKSK